MLQSERPIELSGNGPGLTVGDVILDKADVMWLAACFSATDWAREPAPDHEPTETRVEVRNDYVSRRTQRRLWTVPDLVTRSIDVLHSKPDIEPDVLAEIRKLESDALVLKEAHSGSWQTWDDTTPEARRLTILYLIKGVVVGAPSLPIDQQFRIIWRWNRPWGEHGFSARVGQPSTRLTSRREVVSAQDLVAGDTIYWLSRYGKERGRLVSDVWKSEETLGAVCIRLEEQSLGDTFWPGEQFARAKRTR